MNRNPHALERRLFQRPEPGLLELHAASQSGVASPGLERGAAQQSVSAQRVDARESAAEPGGRGAGDEESSKPDGAFASYLRTISGVAELSAATEAELARRARLGDAAAREALIRAHLASVVRMARRYTNLGLPLMDLIGEGNLGLMLAVDRYDPAAGARFIAYASFWIRRQIRLGLSTQSRLIRLPVHRQNDLRRINVAAAELQAGLGRQANVEEIALATSLPPATVRTVLGAIPKMISLDAPPAADELGSLADSLPDENAADPAAALLLREVTDPRGLADAVRQLKPRDRDVICARFGFAGCCPMTLGQLARRLNLTCEGVRQIQSRALRKLRREIRRQRLQQVVAALPGQPAADRAA